MTALSPTACLVSKDKQCENYADYIIYIGNVGYGICKECFKHLSNLHQIILKSWTDTKE